MPRTRQYHTRAEKQAAYRQREQGKDDALYDRLYALERAIWAASDAGDTLAQACRATTIEAMLSRLIAHFDGHRASGQELGESPHALEARLREVHGEETPG
jgi:hypothetical protein